MAQEETSPQKPACIWPAWQNPDTTADYYAHTSVSRGGVKLRETEALTSAPHNGVLVVLSGVSLRKAASMKPHTIQRLAQAIWRTPRTSTLFWLKMKYLCRAISGYKAARKSPLLPVCFSWRSGVKFGLRAKPGVSLMLVSTERFVCQKHEPEKRKILLKTMTGLLFQRAEHILTLPGV